MNITRVGREIKDFHSQKEPKETTEAASPPKSLLRGNFAVRNKNSNLNREKRKNGKSPVGLFSTDDLEKAKVTSPYQEGIIRPCNNRRVLKNPTRNRKPGKGKERTP